MSVEPERELANDMARRALPLAPVVVLIAGVLRGGDGVWSALVAVAVVVVNLLLASRMLSAGARISPTALMAAALGGFLLRMGLVTAVVFAVRNQPWIDLPTLAVAILGTHLALLVWETKYVSASLAFPALKPKEHVPVISLFAIDFPPVSHVIEWPSGPLGINKVVVLMWLSAILVFGLLYVGGRKQALVPKGVQNIAESAVEFVQEGIILQTIGPDGLAWTPLLLTFFTFIFACNIWEVIPLAQMPVNARMALPLFMALLVWAIFMTVGIIKQGPLKFFKNMCFPPGVPKPIYILVAPIEFVSTVLVRPLSQSVRLFANMLAGHLLLTSFAIITASLWSLSALMVIWPFSFFLLIALTGFEVLVAFLQAFIFTILTAVYISSSAHPEH